MDTLITNMGSYAGGIFEVGGQLSTWAIADPLCQFGITLTVIGVVSGLILKLFHRFSSIEL